MKGFEDDGFSLDIVHGDDRSTIVVKGELDVKTSNILRDAVACCLDRGGSTVKVEGGGITSISAAGITTLVDSVTRCRDAGTVLQMDLSEQARKILDMVGLWWLGIVDDGVAIHLALQKALRAYAEQTFDRDPRQGPASTAS